MPLLLREAADSLTQAFNHIRSLRDYSGCNTVLAIDFARQDSQGFDDGGGITSHIRKAPENVSFTIRLENVSELILDANILPPQSTPRYGFSIFAKLESL